MKKIDTRGNKRPQTRHLAIINSIQIPYGERELTGDIAATVCGKFIRRYWDAEQTSYYFSDGTVYTKPCPVCLPDEPVPTPRIGKEK